MRGGRLALITIRQFEGLRDLLGKCVEEDIKFRPDRGMGPNLVFRKVPVHNALGLRVLLKLPSISTLRRMKSMGCFLRMTMILCINDWSRGEDDPAASISRAMPRTAI